MLLRCLYVEDDGPKFRAVVRTANRLGFEIAFTRAYTLDDFRVKLDADPPDFVITDWSFPRSADDFPDRAAGAVVAALCERIGMPFFVVSGYSPQPGFGLESRWVQYDRLSEQLGAQLERVEVEVST